MGQWDKPLLVLGVVSAFVITPILLMGVFIAAAFGGVGGSNSSSGSTGGTLNGNCNYDQILSTVADGKAQGESTAAGAPQTVPKQYVGYYTDAANRFKLGGCGASILAGIHSIESGFGGDSFTTVNGYGAGGPFQFLSATYAAEKDGCGGPPWPGYGVKAGACAAANYLHNSGAPNDWKAGIFAYNHADWYVYGVVLQAKHFASQTGGSTNSGGKP